MTFEWISNDGDSAAFIAIDNQRRFYLSAGTRALLDNPTALIFGYDKVNKRIIAAKPDVVRAVNVRPYPFDKRWYASARSFIKKAGISKSSLPLRFYYVGRDYGNGELPAGSYAFELGDYNSPDGGLTPTFPR
ncbi:MULTISPECIES: hypothetical protein [Heyndrickxia]|uniref:hypothetical protein n=1 Tax=Heyndrickxia TaxID=2837504 RepID=UPI002E1D74B2|nr:hypothetical protein [Weizmannia sp. CD-2023]